MTDTISGLAARVRRPRAAPPQRGSGAQRGERGRRGSRVGWLLAAVLAPVAAIAGLAWSPALDVDRVQVLGTRRLPAEQARAAASVDLGAPLAVVDLGRARAQVEALPYVKSAVVRRDWPDRVVVEIVERVPALAVPVDGGVVLYDPDGVRLGGAAAPPRGVPLLRVAGGRPAANLVQAVVAVVGAIPAQVRAQVLGYTATTPEDVRFALTGDREVVWGGSDSAAAKSRVLVALLRRPGTHYDVRAPAAPAVR